MMMMMMTTTTTTTTAMTLPQGSCFQQAKVSEPPQQLAKMEATK
jgi:hypothetical protein